LVRDVTYDDHRSQVHTGTTPQVLAALRNLAISAIRSAAHCAAIIATATRQHDRTVDLIGVQPRLCT